MKKDREKQDEEQLAKGRIKYANVNYFVRNLLSCSRAHIKMRVHKYYNAYPPTYLHTLPFCLLAL